MQSFEIDWAGGCCRGSALGPVPSLGFGAENGTSAPKFGADFRRRTACKNQNEPNSARRPSHLWGAKMQNEPNSAKMAAGITPQGGEIARTNPIFTIPSSLSDRRRLDSRGKRANEPNGESG